MSRPGTSSSLLQQSPCIHPLVPLHPTTLSESTPPPAPVAVLVLLATHACMAGAVSVPPPSRQPFPGRPSILTSPHRPIDRLPNLNTIKQRAHPPTESSTSHHEPRANLKGRLTVSEDCRVLQTLQPPSSRSDSRQASCGREREGSMSRPGTSPPSFSNRLAHPHVPLHPTTLSARCPPMTVCPSLHSLPHMLAWLAPSLSHHHLATGSLFWAGHPSSPRPTVRSIDCFTL